MKILQIFGTVVAVHVFAFIFIFASPGCQSGPRTIPTPDATAPASSAPVSFAAPTPVDTGMAPTPVDNGYATTQSSGYASPTRPGSPNAAAYTPPPKPVADVAPVSTYTVTRGDSLWSIAKKHGLSASELARTNNLSTNAILQPGKKLIVPGATPAPQDLATTAPAEKTTVPEKTAVTRPAGESIKHTVQPGEVLGAIAKRYGVKVADLVTENSITNPALVRAGQQLSIPGTRAVRAAGTPAPKQSAAATAAPASAQTPAAQTPATQTPPVEASTAPNGVPRIELAPPPPGEDLDAGLKETSTEVPTIKVELPPAPKN